VLKIWWDKFLGCGTASKQLPQSPKTEIRGLVGNPSRQIPLGVKRGSTTSPRVWKGCHWGKDLAIGIAWLKHYPSLKPEDRYTHKQKGSHLRIRIKMFDLTAKKSEVRKNWMPPSPHVCSSYHPKKWIVQFQWCCIFVKGNRFYRNMHIARKNATKIYKLTSFNWCHWKTSFHTSTGVLCELPCLFCGYICCPEVRAHLLPRC